VDHSPVVLTLGSATASDYFASSPLSDPLSYPGVIPPHSYLLLGPGRLRKLRLAEPSAGRHAVLAIGSNASPAQLIRKFGGISPVVPVAAASVSGLRILPSGHLNAAGYVPWSPVFRTRNSSAEEFAGSIPAFVTFLDDAQLARMDSTEPNYSRVPLPASHSAVRLDGAQVELAGCSIYVSRHGTIVDERIVRAGELPSQSVLLSRLIATLSLGVTTPLELIAALRSGQLLADLVTDRIREHLRVNPPQALPPSDS
jgi:hypothetical protein